ncbi:hypothetical protein, partial [Streptococcus anginosus]|uniref:hypothetical protein n=1 Tax=Streptococcus anginosus TaxID=1328 RepID=UPI002EDA5C79
MHQEGRGKVNAIIVGDFNSVVGEGCQEMIVGAHGLGRRNERWKMLIDFCKQHDLIVTNTRYKKRKIKLYTWKNLETPID